MTENTRIKITSPTITIENGPGGAGDKKKYLKIAFANTTDIAVWNDSLGTGNKGANIPIDDNTNHFKTGANATDRIQPDSLRAVWIKFDDEKTAKRYARLAKLRDLFSGEPTAGAGIGTGTQVGNWEIITKKLRYDGADTGTTYFDDEDKIGLINATDLKLNSKVDGTGSFVNGATKNDIICIDGEEWTDGNPADTNVFSYKKTVDEYWNLCDLHDEIEEMLSGNIDIDKTKIDNWLLELRKYASTTAANADKHRVYEADFGNDLDDEYLQDTTDEYYDLLCELKVWGDCGLSNAKEVLKANANGFIINERGGANATVGNATHGVKEINIDGNPNANGAANVVAIKKLIKDGLYKGFKIVGADQDDSSIVDAAGANANLVLMGKKANASQTGTILQGEKDTVYLKDAIDNFCSSFGTKTDWGGKGDYHGFYPVAQNTYLPGTASTDDNPAAQITYRIGGGYEITAATKLTGRISKDVAKFNAGTAGTVDGTNHIEGYEHKDLTKTCFDILQAPGLDDADTGIIDLMLKTDYDGAGTGQKKEVLKKMLICAQNATNAGYGTAAAGSGKFENADKIHSAYDEADNFLTYFDVDYSSKNKSNETELKKAESELEKYKNPSASETYKKKISDFWQDKTVIGGKKKLAIDEKLTQIRNALGTDAPKQPDSKKFDKGGDLTKAINDAADGSDEKKVYEDFESESNIDIKNNDVWAALKALVGKLKGGAIDEPEAELETAYSKKGDTEAAKIAWKFVNDHAKDSNGKGWADRVLETARASLETALSSARTAMESESGAADLILAGVKKISLATKIKEVFEKCKEAHGTPSVADKGNIETKLTEFKDSEAWKAVNKYTKSGSTQPYATEALEKVKNSHDKDKADYSDLLKLSTPEEARKEGEAKKTEEDIIKRAQIGIKFKNSSDDKEKLILSIFAKEATEHSDGKDAVEKSLENVNKYIEALGKIINATDKNSDYGKLKAKLEVIDDKWGETGTKKFLESWKNALETRKKHLESKQKEYKKNDGNNTNGDPKPWWKTTGGIIGIIVGIVLVLGLIAYFIKTNSSEEGEGSDEE